jgi:hypothetical protein
MPPSRNVLATEVLTMRLPHNPVALSFQLYAKPISQTTRLSPSATGFKAQAAASPSRAAPMPSTITAGFPLERHRRVPARIATRGDGANMALITFFRPIPVLC